MLWRESARSDLPIPRWQPYPAHAPVQLTIITGGLRESTLRPGMSRFVCTSLMVNTCDSRACVTVLKPSL
jgi:hypothetical protein